MFVLQLKPDISMYAVVSVLVAGSILSFALQKLTAFGAMAGFIVGLLTYVSADLNGVFMLASFFVLGTMATAYKKSEKQSIALYENDSGKRDAGQVFANGGVAAVAGLATIFFPQLKSFMQIAVAASLAAALSDTFSSEFGNVYGSKYINILTLKKDQRGENGVISLEGTLFGFIGSAIIALIFAVQHQSLALIVIISIAGLTGNFVDSILGAKWERRGVIGNNIVNFINTLIAAVVAITLSLLG